MYAYLFDRKSLVLYWLTLFALGLLLFLAGIFVGFNWHLPQTPAISVHSTVASFPASRPAAEQPKPAAVPPLPTTGAAAAATPPPPPPASSASPAATSTAAVPPVVSVNGALYSVQVGAFGQEQNAQNEIALLQAKGYEPYVVPVTDDQGATLYTVRIGRYEMRAEAEAAAASFAESEGGKPIVRSLPAD